ncbi:MAG: metalloregulator ArsR/SmtB family transcription factor [Geobacteraceae bacterium]|nr:metalloregulator ArsR/SmtB family transcription factor [Geobacteraceae bacterium]
MSPESEKLIFELHAKLCKALSNPKRLEIIATLRDREMSVGELAERLAIPIGNLSQHLNMMKGVGMLNSRKEGNVVFYSLATPKMLEAFDILREILFERISREEAVRKKFAE